MLTELTAAIDRRLAGLIRGHARRKSAVLRVVPARWLDPLLASSVRRLRIQLIVGALGLSLLLSIAGLYLALPG